MLISVGVFKCAQAACPGNCKGLCMPRLGPVTLVSLLIVCHGRLLFDEGYRDNPRVAADGTIRPDVHGIGIGWQVIKCAGTEFTVHR